MGTTKSKHSYKVATTPIRHQMNDTPMKTNVTKPVPASTSVEAPPPATAATTPVKNDTRVVPTWINESQFVEILRETVPHFEKIKSFNAKPGLNAGENYASLMLRVSIEVELTDKSMKNVSYMMKVPHDFPEMQQMLDNANFFEIENEAYIDVLPHFEALYKEKGLDITFVPRAYRFKEGVKVEPKLANTVLMYDLGQDGYKNANRLECLNLEQTKYVLKKMAQFHAAGAHYYTQHELSENMIYGMYGKNMVENIQMMDDMMIPMQKLFLNNLKNFKNGEIYKKKLETYFTKMREFFLLMTDPYDKTEFNVLTHGDSWVNNLLFKFAPNGDIIDMIYVDFQNPRFANPLADILYFLMTSVNIEYKLTYFDFFLKYYHDNLIEHLDILGYTGIRPKLLDFHIQLYKYSIFAIMGAYMVLPVVLLDPTESATFENFFKNNQAGQDFKNLMFSSKRFINNIEKILPWMDNRGLLEIYSPSDFGVYLAAGQTSSAQIEIDPAAPAWVTIEYFKELLCMDKTDFKDIEKFQVKKATEAGDNYSSIMLSVDIDYLTTSGGKGNVSYMLKVPPRSSQVASLLDLMATFKKEIAMYDEVVPQLEELYKQAGHPIIISPKSYKFKNSPKEDHILLENLRPAGYKNSDRLNGLNVNETEHVLAKLAKLHAASAQLYLTKGQYSDCLIKPVHNEETKPIFMSPENKSFMNLAIEAVKTFKGSEVFGDKVAKILGDIDEVMEKGEEFDDHEFNVINHGDCWTNNIMFAHDAQGNITDTLFIDFQRSNWNSPAMDLYYFLFSSPSFDIKIEKFDYFVRYYHDELQRNLELLKYPKHIPTLKEIHIALLKSPELAVTPVSTVMTAVLLDPTENASIETMLGDNEEGKNFKRKLFNNDRYRKHAEALYLFLNYRGLLDIE